jgi:SAM-dependent methyltransferase
MLGLRERVCFEIARRMLKPPTERGTDLDAYIKWRDEELERQWAFFSDGDIRGKDVLDFGCGPGGLSFHLAQLEPKRIIGIELDPEYVKGCDELKRKRNDPRLDCVTFALGSVEGLPFPDASFDTILAFDCLEHIMQPVEIMRDWRRVLRPGGKVLAWWSPYKSPYGPHMEAIVPIPWGHVIFGERAMLRAAARIYDSDHFVPTQWHLAKDGTKKPNKWRQWSSFKEQGYINQLSADGFMEIAGAVGLDVTRFDAHSFSGTTVRRMIGQALVRIPFLGEYMTSYYIVECTKR